MARRLDYQRAKALERAKRHNALPPRSRSNRAQRLGYTLVRLRYSTSCMFCHRDLEAGRQAWWTKGSTCCIACGSAAHD